MYMTVLLIKIHKSYYPAISRRYITDIDNFKIDKKKITSMTPAIPHI